MKTMLYIILGIVVVLLTILILGLLLPKKRIVTKQTVYNASVETVYITVTNNKDWKYRTSLEDLRIVNERRL